MTDLHEVIAALMAKPPRRRAAALYQPGTVLAVNQDGTYVIDLAGRRVTANPETDLPLTVGQAVYVSEVRNGKPVVHGPR